MKLFLGACRFYVQKFYEENWDMCKNDVCISVILPNDSYGQKKYPK